jgi:cytochrome c peroxidase
MLKPMKKFNLILAACFIVLCTSIAFISCRKPVPLEVSEPNQDKPDLPATPYGYYEKNGVNDHYATLGRVLFYDKNLSVNNAVSCGSCHKQEFAFANNVRFDKGYNGVNLTRNSPSIQGIQGFQFLNPRLFNNGGFFGNGISSNGIPDKENQLQVLLFWDGRQNSVADMVMNPVLNHNEMNIPDFETLINKLQSTEYYPPLFKNAYGDEAITKERIAFAMEAFISCLNPPEPTIGRFMTIQTHENGVFVSVLPNDSNLTPLEKEGQRLFHEKYNCALCHDPSQGGGYGAATSPSQMFNIGLDEVYPDGGLGRITGKPGDQGLFKVPTLKNIAVTAPYMHDGRFSNLGEVIDHYSHGIKANKNLSPKFLNIDGTPKKLNILPSEKQALIAFLTTLKDEDFLTSPMYSDPFKK